MRRFCAGTILAIACGALVGCGAQGGGVAVEGTVAFNGKPLTRGIIGFIKTGSKAVGGPISSEGRYELTLSPGDYKVRVDSPTTLPPGWKEGDPPPKMGPREAPEKYSYFESSGLTATVKADSSSQTIDFSLP